MTAADYILAVLSSAFGSVGLFSFVQFLVSRKDKRRDLLGKIDKKLDKLEKDGCRTQLLLMICDYPDNVSEIMELAEHYFADLKGNWYMSSVFDEYLKGRGLAAPAWFRKG